MKKLLVSLLIAGSLLASASSSALATSQPEYQQPDELVCVEGQVEITDNQTFEKGNLIKVTYRWHIVSQTETEVTYQLQFDADPRGGHELWLNVRGQVVVLAIPECEVPEEPEVPQEPVIERALTPAGVPDAPICKEIIYAPTITKVGRVDADSVSAEWTTVADYINDYVLWFSDDQSNPFKWNEIVYDRQSSVVNLVPNTHIWFTVQGLHDAGCVGPMSETIDP